MTIDDFNHTIDIYINALRRYTFEELCVTPSARSWSIGQMYIHLIQDTGFYIDQIEIATASDEQSDRKLLPHGKWMLDRNEFPDEIIEGAPSNAFIAQPPSKQQLMQDLLSLKERMINAATLISNTSFSGKTKHPGLGYFNASEWFQLAEMHFRHHLRQKKRIDEFLGRSRSLT
jgi:hypothetical protein